MRELLSPWTAHPFDFEIWLRLGYYVSKGLDPYRMMQPITGLSIPGTGDLPSIGYPPLWPFVEAAIYDLYSFLGVNDRFLYYFLLKQPMILGDAVVGLLILKLVSRRAGTAAGERGMTFWMLCPFVIVISSVWGMFDQLVLAFILGGLVVLDRTVRSALLEFVGVFLKGFPVVFLPALALSQRGLRGKVAYPLLAAGLTAVFSLLPYYLFPGWNLASLFATGTDITSKVGNTINYGVVVYVISNLAALPASAAEAWRAAGYLWIPATAAAYVYYFRRPFYLGDPVRRAALGMLFVTLVYFLSRLNLNEQFVLYFMAFGLFDLLTGGARRWKLFNGVWGSALVFLVANNTFMVRFLSPVSDYFMSLNDALTAGYAGDVRFVVMVAAGMSFTLFVAMYLKSLDSQLRSEARGAEGA